MRTIIVAIVLLLIPSFAYSAVKDYLGQTIDDVWYDLRRTNRCEKIATGEGTNLKCSVLDQAIISVSANGGGLVYRVEVIYDRRIGYDVNNSGAFYPTTLVEKDYDRLFFADFEEFRDASSTWESIHGVGGMTYYDRTYRDDRVIPLSVNEYCVRPKGLTSMVSDCSKSVQVDGQNVSIISIAHVIKSKFIWTKYSAHLVGKQVHFLLDEQFEIYERDRIIRVKAAEREANARRLKDVQEQAVQNNASSILSP